MQLNEGIFDNALVVEDWFCHHHVTSPSCFHRGTQASSLQTFHRIWHNPPSHQHTSKPLQRWQYGAQLVLALLKWKWTIPFYFSRHKHLPQFQESLHPQTSVKVVCNLVAKNEWNPGSMHCPSYSADTVKRMMQKKYFSYFSDLKNKKNIFHIFREKFQWKIKIFFKAQP